MDADADDYPLEFQEISEEDFAHARDAYARELKDAAPGAPSSPPPLNPEQRAYARERCQAQRILAAGRAAGDSREATLEKLRAASLAQVSLLQGEGGVGKSVWLHALARNMKKYNWGHMAITAWTGVASAPFRAPTLCSLLGIDFARLHQEPHKSEEQMGAIRTEYARYFGEPSDLAVFVIDEASFLEPAALHWVDKLLRWLVGEPDVPFGGVLLILAGDFWQKPPPAALRSPRPSWRSTHPSPAGSRGRSRRPALKRKAWTSSARHAGLFPRDRCAPVETPSSKRSSRTCGPRRRSPPSRATTSGT